MMGEPLHCFHLSPGARCQKASLTAVVRKALCTMLAKGLPGMGRGKEMNTDSVKAALGSLPFFCDLICNGLFGTSVQFSKDGMPIAS